VAVKFVGAVGGVVSVTIVMNAPLLATPPTVTTTFPVVAPVGTGDAICVSLQPKNCVARAPLKATVPVPLLAPKVVPVIVTVVPTDPLIGLKPVMFGATVKGI
jgi:hypothetical protein